MRYWGKPNRVSGKDDKKKTNKKVKKFRLHFKLFTLTSDHDHSKQLKNIEKPVSIPLSLEIKIKTIPGHLKPFTQHPLNFRNETRNLNSSLIEFCEMPSAIYHQSGSVSPQTA